LQREKKSRPFAGQTIRYFNVSERSARVNRVSGNGATLLLAITPAQPEGGPA
jgi:hypothetical protein